MKILQATRMDRCTGCLLCSLACSRFNYGFLSLTRTGIHIRATNREATSFEAVHCLACNPAPCARACSRSALLQKQGGGVELQPNSCDLCGYCVQACPVGAIHLDWQLGQPVYCQHCGSCVEFCPCSCLEMLEVESEDASHAGQV